MINVSSKFKKFLTLIFINNILYLLGQIFNSVLYLINLSNTTLTNPNRFNITKYKFCELEYNNFYYLTASLNFAISSIIIIVNAYNFSITRYKLIIFYLNILFSLVIGILNIVHYFLQADEIIKYDKCINIAYIQSYVYFSIFNVCYLFIVYLLAQCNYMLVRNNV